MSLIQYDPLHEFDRLFEDAITSRFPSAWMLSGNPRSFRGGQESLMKPKMDVHEDSASNTVVAMFELPGLKKEDVNIDLQHNRLTISGEAKQSTECDEKGWAVRERSYGAFSRSLQVPPNIKPEQIKASMENGVLTVTFPKLTPEQAPKKITVS